MDCWRTVLFAKVEIPHQLTCRNKSVEEFAVSKKIMVLWLFKDPLEEIVCSWANYNQTHSKLLRQISRSEKSSIESVFVNLPVTSQQAHHRLSDKSHLIPGSNVMI